MADISESTLEASCGCSAGPVIVSAKGSHKVFTAKQSYVSYFFLFSDTTDTRRALDTALMI